MSETLVQFPNPIRKLPEPLPPDVPGDVLKVGRTQFMDFAVNPACNALSGERMAERKNSRNGLRPNAL